MRQQVKKKPVKWAFKFWYCCASATGYLYQLGLYLGKQDEVELNLSESVVLKMCKVLEKSYYTLYFDNFFNNPLLISKLFKKACYLSILKECRPSHRFNAKSGVQQQSFLYRVLMLSNFTTKVWVEWIQLVKELLRNPPLDFI